eukprot:TRINITY_DN14069_c0_g1_i1.p1 TRINITY_DN14069_c0_g1~~TRINITY_DN14069_c0_g1_i1.p1  ORF type:complete len:768 (+),score=117.88 TRINITY_DN14069_c0_g1_i1:221-2305(+)
MIASRIELSVAEATPAEINSQTFIPYSACTWRRLGYCTLNTNEAGKARELKTVYVTCKAVYLRLVLQQCHINPANFFNQVGMVAINASGELLSPFGILPPAGAALRTVDLRELRPTASTGQSPKMETSWEKPVTTHLRDLTQQKQRAVESEDYETAKALKEKIDAVKQVAKRLTILESEKQAAIQREDYDAATRMKREVENVRRQLNDLAPRKPPHHLTTGAPLSSRVDTAVLAQSTSSGLGASSLDEVVVGTGLFEVNRNIDDIVASQDPFNQQRRELAEVHQSFDWFDPRGKPDWELALMKELRDVLGDSLSQVQDQPRDQDARTYIKVFGSALTYCLLSRKWQLREAAMKILLDHLRKGNEFGAPLERVHELLLRYLAMEKLGLAEPTQNAWLAALDLLEAALNLDVNVDRNQRVSHVIPLLGLVLLKAVEGNQRTREQSIQLLLRTARNSRFGSSVLAHVIFLPDSASDRKSGASMQLAKLQLLNILLKEFGIQSQDHQTGLTVDAIMGKVTTALNSAQLEVRQAAIRLAVMVANSTDRQTVMQYLKGAKLAVIASIDEALGTPAPAPAANGDEQPEEPLDRCEEQTAEVPCEFCGIVRYWTEAETDNHLAEDCAWLMSCPHCGMVVPINEYSDHTREECSGNPPQDKLPTKDSCPLCQTPVVSLEDWRKHLLSVPGCPANPRSFSTDLS